MPRRAKNSRFCLYGHDKHLLGCRKDGTCLICSRAAIRRHYRRHLKAYRKYYAENRSSILEVRKKHWKKINIKRRESWLKQKFNLTLSERVLMLDRQGGVCAICERKETTFKRYLCVDHNHTSGRIRGLLCTNCNVKVLPVIEHYSQLIAKAQQYLRKYEEEKHDLL